MPRPVSPPLLTKPVPTAFKLAIHDSNEIARTLGYSVLPPEYMSAMEHAIASYLAIKDETGVATVKGVVAALEEIKVPGRKREAATARLANDRWGGDQQTHALLQPLAQAALSGNASADAALMAAVNRRLMELGNHLRVYPKIEALRDFCGRLRVMFQFMASIDTERTWDNCGRFALAALSAAGAKCDQFIEHPARLREYLSTDVSPAIQ